MNCFHIKTQVVWQLKTRLMLILFGLILQVISPLLAEPLMAACDQVPNFSDGLTPQRYLHVATLGSDDTGDGSPAAPYATIGAAVRVATPGTAIVVHAGQYTGGLFLYDLHGSAQAPIWIGGAAGESPPIISGGNEGLHLVRPRYVILHDLEVRDCLYNGINLDDGGDYDDNTAAQFLLFDNLDIHDIGGSGNQDGLKLSGVNDYTVHNCRFARCGGGASGSGIDQVGCHRGTIARCRFDAMSGSAVQCKGGSEDIEIRWCHFTDAGERGVNIGGSTGFTFFRPPLSATEPNVEARQIRVLANIFVGSSAPVAFVGCLDSVVTNNTIVNPDRWILRILQETVGSDTYEFLPCGDNRFENNLIYFNRGALSTYLNIGPNTTPATFIFSNNLWFAHDDPGASTPSLPTSEIDGRYGLDPQLQDPDEADFRIDQDSPAAANGLSPPLIDGDIDGYCFRLPPSIGAHAVMDSCSGNFNADGDVDGEDLRLFGNYLPSADSRADLNGDNRIDAEDMMLFSNDFGRGDCY
jgi:hypothetical protein